MMLVLATVCGALVSSLIEVALFFVFRKRIMANMESWMSSLAPRQVEEVTEKFDYRDGNAFAAAFSEWQNDPRYDDGCNETHCDDPKCSCRYE